MSDLHDQERARALEKYADRIEEDRREPDKILCHALSMRSAALAAREEPQAWVCECCGRSCLEPIVDPEEGFSFCPACAVALPKRAVRGERARTVLVARCPEHGLHGCRETCFECGGPVEQVPMTEVAAREDTSIGVSKEDDLRAARAGVDPDLLSEGEQRAARENTERPDASEYECVEYRTVIKRATEAEPLIQTQWSKVAADEWLSVFCEEYAASIEYARVEWRMVSQWIEPPDRRFFTRRTETNTPRSEMEPNRRKLHDRRGVVRDTEQEHKG